MKKKTKIPKFKTYGDEAHFWDTHNVTDFENETEDVDIIFELDKPRDKTLMVRLQKDFKEKLKTNFRHCPFSFCYFQKWAFFYTIQ